MTKLVPIFTLLLLFSSCANYMQGVYRDLDRATQNDMLANNVQYKKHRRMKSRRFKNINDNSGKVRRKYQSTRTKKRATAEDLIDNSPSLSLWAGANKEQNLFTEDARKRNGDIVLINVESSLKDEISRELKRAFPSRSRLPKPGKSAQAGEPANPTAAPAAPAPEDDKVESTVYDRISSVVIEEVNKNYLLLRGRKTVLFRKRKRMIELQALVSRRDITIEDAISSANLLEATINIVR